MVIAEAEIVDRLQMKSVIAFVRTRKQGIRAVRQAQELGAFLKVGAVGRLVRRDLTQEAVLLGTPLG